MDPSRTAPVDIELHREAGELHIKWKDDHETVYTAAQLRAICPCAGCSVARAERGASPAQDPPDHSGVACLSLEPCGNYAIRLKFSDGHNTGIYSWDILRDRDPSETA